MVRRRVDRCHPVRPSWKATRHIDRNRAIHRRTIHALKERELRRVRRRRLGEGIELLNDDVRVADDVALGVDLLRGGVVVRFGVDEVTGFEVGDGHGDVEVLVCGDVVEVLRVREFTGGDVRRCGNDTCHIHVEQKKRRYDLSIPP